MITVEKSALLRSHEELRGALRIAAKEIRKLNFGRRDTPVLELLRRVWRDARGVGVAETRRSTSPSTTDTRSGT